jgi:transposase
LQSAKFIDMRLPIAVPSGRIVRDRSKYAPVFNVRKVAYMHLGVDLFAIKGVSHNTVLCVLSNMSREEMKKFPTVKNFTSWLRLAPNNKKTGGKIISSRTPKGKNQIALALRQAANSIGNQKDHPLTHFFKRVAYKKGRVAAITATARKLAVIIYHMITRQQAYEPIIKSVVLSND